MTYTTHNTTRPAGRLLAGAAAAALLLAPLSVFGAPKPAAAPARTAVAASTIPAAATGTYGVDKAHTDITFTVPHMAVSKVRGRFTEFDAAVQVDAKKPESSSVRFTIQTDSIDTGNTQRDTHLKSADFFDTSKYPQITFQSSRISKRKTGEYAATGNLSIHGVSRPVVLPFTLTGPVKGMEGALHFGVETGITINRRDYGLTWGKVVEGSALVGDQVVISIDLDLVKQTPAKTSSR